MDAVSNAAAPRRSSARSFAPCSCRNTAHAGCAACDLNVRAELSKLRHMQKSPLKNGLPKFADACRLQNRCHQKSLCVGRIAGIRRGRNRKQRQKLSHCCRSRMRSAFRRNFAARLAKTLDHRQQQPCVAAQKLCLAAAACCHAEIRRRLNPVGKNRIRRAVQTAYAANLKA